MKYAVAVGNGEVKDSFFTEKAIKRLEKMGEIIYPESGKTPDKEELKKMIAEADVLFSGWGTPRVDEEVLSAAPNLKIHAHTGGSVKSYVCKEEYDRGICVLSGNDRYAHSVAEGCMFYMLAALRKFNLYQDTIRNGGWRPENGNNSGLIGKKIALIGYGAIARYVAHLLRWFEVDLYIVSDHISEEELREINGKKVSLEEAMEACDILSFHNALTDETRGMYTRKELSKIRKGTLLVNTARAGLFAEQDLYEELKTGRFYGVFDVYHTEPLPPDHCLRSMDNVLLMPHMAGPTYDMRENVVLTLLDDIENHLEGRPCRSEISYEYAMRMTIT